MENVELVKRILVLSADTVIQSRYIFTVELTLQ